MWPAWREAPLATTGPPPVPGAVVVDGTVRWAPQPGDPPWPPGAATLEHLSWIAQNRDRVRPWFPTPDQLAARIKEQRDLERDADGPTKPKTVPRSLTAPNHGRAAGVPAHMPHAG